MYLTYHKMKWAVYKKVFVSCQIFHNNDHDACMVQTKIMMILQGIIFSL